MADRQLLWAKAEAVYGEDPVAAAVNTILCENVSFKMTGQRVKPNPAKPGVGPVPSWTYGEVVDFSCEVPLIGSGTPGVAPKHAPLWKACGWGETVVEETSVTYAPLYNPKGGPSLTMVWRDDRRAHKILGFRGRPGFKLSKAGRPMAVFTGKALHTDVTTGAALAHADANFTGWLDSIPVANGTTQFELNEIDDLGLHELTIDQSDNVKFFDLPGMELVDLLGERAFTGKAKITTPLPSVLNVETLWKAGTQIVASMTHDTVAGRIVTVNMRGQIVDPDYAREDELDTTSFSFELNSSALTVDDDISVVFT